MAINEIYNDPKGRRNSPRSNYSCEVDLVVGERLYKEISDNISETGIFLNSRHPEKYNVFDNLTLSYEMPDSSPVKHTATVIRKTDTGIGVLFYDVNHPRAYRFSPSLGDLFISDRIS